MRAALRGAVAWVLSLGLLVWLTLSGCDLLKANSPRVERFNCLVRVLEPLVGDVLDADELARDVYAGKADMNAVARSLRLTADQIDAYNAAVDACEPPVPMPEGELN